MERRAFLKNAGASALTLCTLGPLDFANSSQNRKLTKQYLLSHSTIKLRASEIVKGMQDLASLADGPVHAAGNTLNLVIEQTPITLEIQVYS